MTEKRILIVEDEAITAMELEESLKKRGYQVIGTLSNGSMAVNFAKENWPDLILMDIRLEGAIDGIEAANQINLFHEIPIIFLTAHSDDLTLARAIKTKSHSFLLKPFNEKELYSNIELAINKDRIYQRSVAFERIVGSMFDLISDSIVTTDGAGIILRVNSNAEYLIGCKRDELTGKLFFDTKPFCSEERDLIAGLIKSANNREDMTGKVYQVALKCPPSQDKMLISVKLKPVRLPSGEIAEIIFILSPLKTGSA